MIPTEHGHASFNVPALGFGAIHINDQKTPEADAFTLLIPALDLGVKLISTGRLAAASANNA